MTKTAHADCDHESTRVARDRCRRARRKQEQERADIVAHAELAEKIVMHRRRSSPEPQPVTTIQVNPGIWKRAMELAGGDRSKIRVLSPTQVEVTG